MIRPIVMAAISTSLLLLLAFNLFTSSAWGRGCASNQEPIRRGSSCRFYGG